MKLQYIDEDKLVAVKSNILIYVDNFKQGDNAWLFDAFGADLLKNFRYNVDDFELMTYEDKPSLTEFENVKKVYGNLKGLSESEATEERLWAGLCLGKFWKYTVYRWGNSFNKPEGIEQHFFFGPKTGIKRSLTRNAMARLWWIGKKTYDENNINDPYRLTKFLCNHSDYIMHFMEINASNNKNVARGFLRATADAVDEGIRIDTNDFGALTKYLNILGGVYIIDFFSEQEIYTKIKNKIYDMTNKKDDQGE